MTNFLWGSWARRDMTLLAVSFALLIASLIAGAKWLDIASGIAFAGAMFCAGASFMESRRAKATA